MINKNIIAVTAMLCAGMADATTLGFELVAQASRTDVTTFNPFETVSTGETVVALLANASGTVLLEHTTYDPAGPNVTQLLTHASGATSVFAVSESSGPNGVGADKRLSASFLAQNGTVVGAVFDTVLSTRDLVRVSQGGAVDVLAGHLQTIGTQQVRPTAFARETGTGAVFGGTGESGRVIAVEAGGALSIVAQRGSALNGQTDIFINSPDYTGMDANRSGQIVFDTTLDGAGVDTSTDPSSGFPTGNTNGLVLASASGLELIVAGGAAAPDGLGTFSQFLRAPEINANGDILFSARVYDAATSTFSSGLFLRKANGDLQTIVRPGDPVPGSTSGATLEFAARYALADDGTILLLASSSDGANPLIRIVDGVAEVVLDGNSQIDLGNGLLVDVTGVNFSGDMLLSADDFFLNVTSIQPSVIDFEVSSSSRQTDQYVLRSTVMAPVPLPSSALLLMASAAAFAVMRRAARA